jgi:diguanylate cyclase (GGDEF)-like protein
MIFGSLHNRIVFFFTILLMLVQMIAFSLINTTSLEIAKKQNIYELNTGNRIFQQLLAQNRQRLIEAATLLSADFGFRKAVATNDTGTILSTLNNHGHRIKADTMLLAGLDNILLADTLHPAPYLGPSPLAALIKVAEKTGVASEFLWIGQQAYQIVLVPVLAPDPIAWVAMGFLVNNALARQLHELTNLHVSFLNKSISNQWTPLASTQAPELIGNILRTARRAVASKRPLSEPIVLDDYATIFSVLQAGDFCVYTVLQRSELDAIQPLQNLHITLVELALVSLVLSLSGGSFLATKLTYPLKMLAEVVDKIRKGDFSQTAELHYAEQAKTVTHRSDIQEVEILRRAYLEILRLAHEDVLTGLPNRALFNDRLNQMVRLAKRTHAPFSVLMADLNRFKAINDTFGHHAGDKVIRIVGKRLRSALRESDTVARLGGDEFAILLTTSDQDQVITLTTLIQRQLELPMEISEQLIDVGCSIGIAFYPQHGEDAETLLRHADSAMYVAKRSGAGAVIYDQHQEPHQP